MGRGTEMGSGTEMGCGTDGTRDGKEEILLIVLVSCPLSLQEELTFSQSYSHLREIHPSFLHSFHENVQRNYPCFEKQICDHGNGDSGMAFVFRPE